MSGAERLDWTTARDRAIAAGSLLGTERVPVIGAAGRVLAAEVTARTPLPHYPSSAMDGWGVAGDPPWRVVAGGDPLGPGTCVTLVTGAEIPSGVTAVLRSEHAEATELDGVVTVRPGRGARPDEPRTVEHIRAAGTEAAAGETLIPAGTRLSPAHLALAAAGGHDELGVARRPRVALVLTGDEVVASGVPGPGRVRDSFGPMLPPVLAALGAEVVSESHPRDAGEELRRAIERTLGRADVLVSTGGTGGSSADHLHPVLAGLGAELLVDGVRIRPGGPSLLARLPDGRLLVGLPGNPLAAVMGILTLLAPLLGVCTGAGAPALGRATVADPIPGRAGSSLLIPFRSVAGHAVPVAHRGSGMLRGLAAADGVLVVPSAGLDPGDPAITLPLPWC